MTGGAATGRGRGPAAALAAVLLLGGLLLLGVPAGLLAPAQALAQVRLEEPIRPPAVSVNPWVLESLGPAPADPGARSYLPLSPQPLAPNAGPPRLRQGEPRVFRPITPPGMARGGGGWVGSTPEALLAPPDLGPIPIPPSAGAPLTPGPLPMALPGAPPETAVPLPLAGTPALTPSSELATIPAPSAEDRLLQAPKAAAVAAARAGAPVASLGDILGRPRTGAGQPPPPAEAVAAPLPAAAPALPPAAPALPAAVPLAEAATDAADPDLLAPAGTAPSGGAPTGLTAAVAFAPGARALEPEAEASLTPIAQALGRDPGLRVELHAFAQGEDLSDRRARRLALERALSVRTALEERGVERRRTHILAMGADPARGDAVELVVVR